MYDVFPTALLQNFFPVCLIWCPLGKLFPMYCSGFKRRLSSFMGNPVTCAKAGLSFMLQRL